MRVDLHRLSKDEIIEQYVQLEAAYADRAVAMRETSKMVRSLYAPKNERLNRELGKATKKLGQVFELAFDKSIEPAAAIGAIRQVIA